MDEPLHPLDGSDDRSSTQPAGPASTTGGVGVARGLASVLVTVLAVPAAYVLLDYATFRATNRVVLAANDSFPTEVYVTMGVAAGLLFIAAAAGRISAFGPLVAAVLWGALPTAWVYADFSSYADAVADIPNAYDDIGFGLLTTGFAVYPAVGGLLLGAALAGRWRRRTDRF